jgi:phosphotransferase system HPr (HPr) family protein
MAAEQTLTIGHPEGLHARPAALLVRAAGAYASEIEVEVRGQKASARSILAILRLGARQGDTVTIRATGSDAAAAVAGLAAFLAGGEAPAPAAGSPGAHSLDGSP